MAISFSEKKTMLKYFHYLLLLCSLWLCLLQDYIFPWVELKKWSNSTFQVAFSGLLKSTLETLHFNSGQCHIVCIKVSKDPYLSLFSFCWSQPEQYEIFFSQNCFESGFSVRKDIMEIAQTIAISNKRGERERYLKQFNSSTIMAMFFLTKMPHNCIWYLYVRIRAV